jgi:DNA-3-methyladenine glycosylase I
MSSAPSPRGRPTVDSDGSPAPRRAGYAAPMRRCPWPGEDPLYLAYHDQEWGVPQHDDGKLFELLVLEGAQAGLSWITILRKREAYRRAFHGFDAVAIARYGDAEVAALLADAGIVRNRLKILATLQNARAFLAVQEKGGFGALVWGIAGGTQKRNAFRRQEDVPAKTAVSDAMSKELARRGFKFVGSTICYAFMQATGMVNDHLVGCFRRGEVGRG